MYVRLIDRWSTIVTSADGHFGQVDKQEGITDCTREEQLMRHVVIRPISANFIVDG